MKSFVNTKLNATWCGLVVLVVLGMVRGERGSPESDDPVGTDGEKARGEDVSSLMGSCLATEMPKVQDSG
jgi:hypothetical protein